MAQSDRFYFWRGYYDALKLLPDPHSREMLVMGMCQWAFDGVEPSFSDNPLMQLAWALVRDQVAESVEIGRDASRRGSMGGRPPKGKKTSAKSRAKTSAKTSALSSAESSAETSAESEGKGTDRKGSDCYASTSVEADAPRLAPGGAARAHGDEIPDYISAPPKPEDM